MILNYRHSSFIKQLQEQNLNKLNSDWYLFSYNLCPGPVLMKKADRVSDKHRKFLRMLKISKEKTIYSWKHTGVVDMYNEIKDPYALMRQLRHYDLQTTMIYLKSLGLQENKIVMESTINIL